MEMDEAGREVDQARMSPEAVLGLIQGALQYGLDSRAWNEQELSKCEEEGRPGYLSSLLMIVAKAQELPAVSGSLQMWLTAYALHFWAWGTPWG